MRRFKITDKKIQEGILILTIETEDGRPFDFTAGQFISITIPNFQAKPVFFSIASPSTWKNKLQFVINIVGPRTRKLSEMNLNDILEVNGPFGKMKIPEEDEIVFIGGGVGIAPMFSMAREIKERNLNKNVTIIYSVRNPNLILFKDELDKYNETQNMKVCITVTDENQEWAGFKGRICSDMVEKVVKNVKNKKYFICGPTKMGVAMKEMLMGMGVDEKNIDMEAWG
jgi:NAD(P)H-flavin reductase